MTPLPPLSSAHRAQLNAGGIANAVIAVRGYGTATSAHADLLAQLGHSRTLADGGDVLLLPVHDVYGGTGAVIARPDRPPIDARGKVKKYLYPRSHVMRLDVHPSARAHLSDASIPLLITEGQKKADAVLTAGFPCPVALAGVFCWKSAALVQWDAIHLKGRLVYLAFDSDSVTNPKVRNALRRLRALLLGWGADVRIVHLPPGPEGSKVGIDDALVAGASLDTLLAEATDTLAPPTLPRQADPRTPLNVTAPDRQTLAEVFGIAAGHGLYRTDAGGLVTIAADATGHRLESLDSTAAVRATLDRLVRSHTVSRDGVEIPRFLPRDVAEMALHESAPPLPVCRGLITSPAFTSDGRLLDTPGYDGASGLFYAPGTFAPLPVPTVPSAEDLAEARRLWDTELLVDFPFASAGDRTAAVALAVTPVVRSMIDGPVPLILATAPTPGAGKGKLVGSCLLPALGPGGQTAAAWPKGEEELRKRLFAMLLPQPRAILFDNVSGRCESSALALVLTAPGGVWDERVLGQSETRRVVCRTLFVMTGNNVTLSDELAQRRTVPIRLLPETAHPEARTGFRHPNLERWATAHRAELLRALCVLVRHWQALGSPAPSCPALGSFEAWCHVVGGVLQSAGYPDFLTNRTEWTALSDPDTSRWEAFTAAWFTAHGGAAVPTSALVPLAEEHDVCAFDDSASPRARATSLGRAIAKRAGRFFGSHQIRQGTAQAARTWFLRTADPTVTTLPALPHLPPVNAGQNEKATTQQNRPGGERPEVVSYVPDVSCESSGVPACPVHGTPQRQRTDGMWRCPKCLPDARFKPAPTPTNGNGHEPEPLSEAYWDGLLAQGGAQ